MATAHVPPQVDELVQTDDLVKRDRFGRAVVTWSSPVVFVFLGYVAGTFTSVLLHLPYFIGQSLGLTCGTYAAGIALSRSFVRNDATIAFITVNPLASLFGKNPLVVYGPGTHFCYWWEQRSADNVVSLVEATEPFTAVVQTGSGTVTFQGSTRLRPNICELHQFISGAAAAASNITGLIIAHIVGFTGASDGGNKPKPLLEVLKNIGGLNDELRKEFKEGRAGSKVSDFERRFGVIVGDTTVEKILPSEDVQKTMSAVTESEVMDTMVAKSFGCASYEELVKKVEDGTFNWATVNQVRTQKMAASGNLQGMDLKDHTFNLNVNGLDQLSPEAAAAFASVLGRFETFKGTRGKGAGGNRPNERR
ncbi:MAG TPA: hypothetical protein VFS75_01285 [Candidatus Paceibacterota bacterium]|nr:hypothetical protein [Candidatus Paceibacterota bacterium]